MWIEILSRHREVTTRARIAGSEVLIGRGYDNDVTLDDPYVAPRHMRIFRDEAGQLIAEDANSANGMFLDGGRQRLTRIVVDGMLPIRIGQTLIRVRETGHVVEAERLAKPDRRTLPIVAAAIAFVVLGMTALKAWLSQVGEPNFSSYLTPLLTLTISVLIWCGLWSLLARIFSGKSRFRENLLIALAGILAILIYGELAQFAAFAWTWPTLNTYQYAALWSVLAVACFLHLLQIGSSRLLLKGIVVVTLLAAMIAVQTLQRSEAFSVSGRQNTAHPLMPPAFRLVPLREEDAFFGAISGLRSSLDEDRVKAIIDGSGQ